MTRSLALAAVLIAGSVLGCNQQPPAEPADVPELNLSIPEEAQVNATPHIPPDLGRNPVAQTPDSVVEAFLAAVRAGNDQATAALLTDKAREETAKHSLAVKPPGTPSAQFSVGGVQYIDANKTGAHVNTVWTEEAKGPNGQAETVTYDVVWALRRQPQGWRVAGIATEIIEGQPPVFLNFEDPSDMLDKWKHAEEIASRHEQTTRQAQAPPQGPATFQR